MKQAEDKSSDQHNPTKTPTIPSWKSNQFANRTFPRSQSFSGPNLAPRRGLGTRGK